MSNEIGQVKTMLAIFPPLGKLILHTLHVALDGSKKLPDSFFALPTHFAPRVKMMDDQLITDHTIQA